MRPKRILGLLLEEWEAWSKKTGRPLPQAALVEQRRRDEGAKAAAQRLQRPHLETR